MFIDEIHRIPIAVQELLYSAMEDFTIDILIGEGPSARTVSINLPKFTLVGATTRMGALSTPLKDRFGIVLKLELYNTQTLATIVLNAAKTLQLEMSNDIALEIAARGRGTPRITLRLLNRLNDFAISNGTDLSKELLHDSLNKLGVDQFGLNSIDRQYITFLHIHHEGGPVGIETITAALNIDKATIQDNIEPYLMQIGFLDRTPRGRVFIKLLHGIHRKMMLDIQNVAHSIKQPQAPHSS